MDTARLRIVRRLPLEFKLSRSHWHFRLSLACPGRDTIEWMIPYFRRVKYAFRSFFSILDHSRVPEDVVAALDKGAAAVAAPATPAPPPGGLRQPAPDDRATQLLALLQRDARLLDFLLEDLGTYGDAQVGAAVRDVHAGCRGVLTRYLSIAPVVAEEEGEAVTVDRGADPARIKVVGNVAVGPPYRGVVRHRGWEVTHMNLPPVPSSGRSILAPAEIEVR